MREWQRKLANAPLPVLFVFYAVSFGGGTYLLGLLVGNRYHSWIGNVIGGVFFGLAMTWWQARQRRRYGGGTGIVDVAEAVRREQLPPDADPEEWRPRLERQERTFRRLRILAPIEFVLFAALGTWLALTRGAVWWLFVVFFVGFGIFGLVASVRSLGRARRLLRRLESGDDRSSTTTSPLRD